MEKSWDLNIFYVDLGGASEGSNLWEDVFTINPCVYVIDNGTADHIYTKFIIKATFAETRWIASQRPEDEWGDDWFEDMEHFLLIAPPRIAEILNALPDPNLITEDNVDDLIQASRLSELLSA